jgi:hypothetical protein
MRFALIQFVPRVPQRPGQAAPPNTTTVHTSFSYTAPQGDLARLALTRIDFALARTAHPQPPCRDFSAEARLVDQPTVTVRRLMPTYTCGISIAMEVDSHFGRSDAALIAAMQARPQPIEVTTRLNNTEFDRYTLAPDIPARDALLADAIAALQQMRANPRANFVDLMDVRQLDRAIGKPHCYEPPLELH